MPSAKGQPTDPKLKEKVIEEVKAMPNKDGSGQGQMAAWKASKIAKEYEAQGGDYENVPGSKDQPQKGPPEKKSEAQKAAETKNGDSTEDAEATSSEEKNKTTANANSTTTAKKSRGRPKSTGGAASMPKKNKKQPAVGTRVSARVQEAEKADRKRKADTRGDEPVAKKARTGTKKGGAKRGRPAANVTATGTTGGAKRGRPAKSTTGAAVGVKAKTAASKTIAKTKSAASNAKAKSASGAEPKKRGRPAKAKK